MFSTWLCLTEPELGWIKQRQHQAADVNNLQLSFISDNQNKNSLHLDLDKNVKKQKAITAQSGFTMFYMHTRILSSFPIYIASIKLWVTISINT